MIFRTYFMVKKKNVEKKYVLTLKKVEFSDENVEISAETITHLKHRIVLIE